MKYPNKFNFLKKYLTQDKKAKTFSFYLLDSVKIDKSFINFLIEFSKENDYCDVRLNLHSNPNESHHDMIILQNKKNKYKPHKHIYKGDTFNIIKGKLGVLIFNKIGKVKKEYVLSKNEVLRTKKNEYHQVIPLSTQVIYHETKKGPFLKKNDSVFPNWVK